MRFEGFHEAYLHHLRLVFREPTYRNAPRGARSRERLAVQFTLDDPRERVPHLPARRLNLVFNFAEALWYLAGRDDLEFIAYYAPSIRRYSMDGRTLAGTAYGRALFHLGGQAGGGLDQWEQVAALLREDPATKRAVMQVFRAEELSVPGNLDVSCTLALQFLARDGALHAVGYMRANDAYRGFSSDVFSFTFLQEVLATQLGLRLGTYTHSVGSLHVYESDAERVEQVLASPEAQQPPRRDLRFPAMPARDNRGALRRVLAWEEDLRHDRRRLVAGDAGTLGLHPYWQQVLLLLEAYRGVRHDQRIVPETYLALEPLYRFAVRHKWGGFLPERVRA